MVILLPRFPRNFNGLLINVDNATSFNESNNVTTSMGIRCTNGITQITRVRHIDGNDSAKAQYVGAHLRVLRRSVVTIIKDSGTFRK